MSSTRKLLLIAMLGASGLLLLPPLTLHFIPDSILKQSAQRMLASKGIIMQATQFESVFPAGIQAEALTLGDATTTAFKADHCIIRQRFLPLLIGRFSYSIDGKIGVTGRFSGVIDITPNFKGSVEITKLSLSDVPALTSALGPGISGTTHINLLLNTPQNSDSSGDIKVHIRDLQIRDTHLGGLPLPDVVFPEVRGLAKIKGQVIKIDNLALQSTDLYIRLNGTISLTQQAPLKLQLELLPNADLLSKQKSVFLMMLPYQLSPGIYMLPINGTLTRPQLAL